MRILLRLVENAPVALYEGSSGATPEMLPTRYDLFQYNGGVSWGYSGTGVNNLAFAIAAKWRDQHRDIDLGKFTTRLVDNLLSKLDQDKPHDIDADMISSAVGIETPA